MFKGQLLVLLVIYIHNSSGQIDGVFNLGKEVLELHGLIDMIKLNTTKDIREVNELFTGNTRRSRAILNQMNKIHDQLDSVEKSKTPKMFRNTLKLSSSNIILYKCLDTLELFLSSIDHHYEEFLGYINGSDYHNNRPLQDFTRRNSLDVEEKILKIRTVTSNECVPNGGNLPDAITNQTVAQPTNMCGGSQIISHILVEWFKMLIIAEIKAQVMLVFANIHLYTLNEEWKHINYVARRGFKRQFQIYVNIFSINMETTDVLYLRACDPEGGFWIRDKSFYELEGTIQSTIFRYHWATCMFNDCNKVWHNKPPLCDAKFYDKRSGCPGTLTDCIYLTSMQACVLKSGPHKFQYLNSTELGLVGKNSKCPRDNGYIIQDGKGWDIPYATCACTCYAKHNRISLALVQSNVEFNMVITGVRFIWKNQLLYIQPRQGTLQANGYVSRSSERWINVPNDIKESQIHSIDEQNRVFFLDDVRLPPHFVLTGIKFNKVTRGTITGFAIEIFGVPFNYETGALERKIQFRASASVEISGQALSFDAISSIYTILPHSVSPPNMKYVSLRRSELKDDSGQSTLPLFDAASITTDPVSLLGGIGIFHKGIEGYAGFISIRVYGIKYAQCFADFKLLHIKKGVLSFTNEGHN